MLADDEARRRFQPVEAALRARGLCFEVKAVAAADPAQLRCADIYISMAGRGESDPLIEQAQAASCAVVAHIRSRQALRLRNGVDALLYTRLRVSRFSMLYRYKHLTLQHLTHGLLLSPIRRMQLAAAALAPAEDIDIADARTHLAHNLSYHPPGIHS